MARSSRSKAAKMSRRNWTTHKSAVLATGAVYGELRVVLPDTGNRKNGHRMALVEDIKTNERKEVRGDNLRNGNTRSCGRIKKERYKKHTLMVQAMVGTNLDELDTELIAEALRDNSNTIDAEGNLCRQNRKAKPGQCYQGTGKDKYGKYRDYYVTKSGQFQCRSAETGYNVKNVDKELEHEGKILE